MQETLNSFKPSPQTRSIERIRIAGNSDPEAFNARSQTTDDELTHAAEIMAAFTGRGVIPREYRLLNGELVTEHGERLSGVLDDGIVDAEIQVAEGKLGAELELRRRNIERSNFGIIKSLDSGFVLIEMSATDLTWTKEERRAQGYNGATMARLTTRVSETTFKQLNVILETSELAVLNRCRHSIEPDTRDAATAEEMLASPQIIEGDILGLARKIEAECAEASINFNAKGLAKSALGRVITRRKVAKQLAKINSWDYVVGQTDIFNALLDSFEAASLLENDKWLTAAALARGGAWYKLLERYSGQSETIESVDPLELRRAAGRAATADQVFTACGGTVEMKSIGGELGSSFIDRMFEVATLINTKVSHGQCASCGRRGDLFGCGVFCEHCNRVWCEEYVLTGAQLQAKDILQKKYYAYSRGSGLFW